MSMMPFVANYDDISTARGFLFKFYCDKCGDGHLSHFEPSSPGLTSNLLCVGGMYGMYELPRAIGGKAHDGALERAVQEGRTYYKQCIRCGKWVCPDVCWNAIVGMCDYCALHEAECGQPNAAASSVIRPCTECGAKLEPGQKFCSGCGTRAV